MNLTFCRYLLWTMRTELIVGCVGMTLLVLLRSEPFLSWRVGNVRLMADSFALLMTAIGIAVSLRVFHDPPGVSVWLQARGMTRRTICQTRFLTGLLVLAALLAWLGILMSTGIRQAVQLSFDSPWFPMVRWHELKVIPQLALCAALPFSAVTLLLTASRTDDSLYPGGWTTISAIAGLLVSFLAIEWIVHSSSMGTVVAVLLLLSGLAVAVALSAISEQHAS
ncbi:MAG: hypothetical protein R3C49_22290 [Planctomycetaceae bacterium]